MKKSAIMGNDSDAREFGNITIKNEKLLSSTNENNPKLNQ